MAVRKSDRNLIEASREAERDLGRIALEGHAKALMGVALVLFDECVTETQDFVARIDKESVEESSAHQHLIDAEDAADSSFGDIYDVLWMTHRRQRLGSADRSASHMVEVKRYLDGNNPSSFRVRARADKIVIMGKALAYVDEYTAAGLVPQAVIDNAQQAYQQYSDAYDKWRAEGGDVTDARNVADTVRPVVRAKYTSARETASAALRLSGADRPISDYCPSLTDIDGGHYTPPTDDGDGAPTPADDTDEPVEA